MNINTILDTKIKGMDANKAMLTMQHMLDNLSGSERLAICWLLQQTQKKAVAKLKPSDSPFKLASLFRAKTDIRYYLNSIYSDGTNLIASNGHMLVKVYHTVEKGFYTDTGILKPDEGMVFPDFYKLYRTLHTDNPCNPDEGERGILDGKKAVPYIKITAGEITAAFNADYIAIAKRAGATGFYLCDGATECYQSAGAHFNMYFKGANFDGVIMGLQV